MITWLLFCVMVWLKSVFETGWKFSGLSKTTHPFSSFLSRLHLFTSFNFFFSFPSPSPTS